MPKNSPRKPQLQDARLATMQALKDHPEGLISGELDALVKYEDRTQCANLLYRLKTDGLIRKEGYTNFLTEAGAAVLAAKAEKAEATKPRAVKLLGMDDPIEREKPAKAKRVAKAAPAPAKPKKAEKLKVESVNGIDNPDGLNGLPNCDVHVGEMRFFVSPGLLDPNVGRTEAAAPAAVPDGRVGLMNDGAIIFFGGDPNDNTAAITRVLPADARAMVAMLRKLPTSHELAL